jgi:hypothetical protein
METRSAHPGVHAEIPEHHLRWISHGKCIGAYLIERKRRKRARRASTPGGPCQPNGPGAGVGCPRSRAHVHCSQIPALWNVDWNIVHPIGVRCRGDVFDVADRGHDHDRDLRKPGRASFAPGHKEANAARRAPHKLEWHIVFCVSPQQNVHIGLEREIIPHRVVSLENAITSSVRANAPDKHVAGAGVFYADELEGNSAESLFRHPCQRSAAHPSIPNRKHPCSQPHDRADQFDCFNHCYSAQHRDGVKVGSARAPALSLHHHLPRSSSASLFTAKFQTSFTIPSASFVQTPPSRPRASAHSRALRGGWVQVSAPSSSHCRRPRSPRRSGKALRTSALFGWWQTHRG